MFKDKNQPSDKKEIILFSNDRITIGLVTLCLITLSIFPLFAPGTFHDSQRLISVLTIFALTLANINSIKNWSTIEISIILFIFLWGGISTALSLSPTWSAIELILFINLAILTIRIFEEVNYETCLILCSVFIICQSIYATRNILNYIFIVLHGKELDIWEVITGFSNIRFYAQFLSWTLPFSIGFVALNKKLSYRNVFIIVIVTSWTLVIMTGTRAFILGIIFSIVATAFITPSLWKNYAKLTLFTGTAGIFGYILLTFILPELFGIDNSSLLKSTTNRDLTSSSGRINIWLETITIAVNNPVFGLGPMMTAMDGVLDKVAHPHNLILQFAAEWGILFAVFSSIFLLNMTYKWSRLARQSKKREKLALPIAASISSAAGASLVDGIIVMPVSLIYMTIVMGMAFSLTRCWSHDTKRFPLPLFFKILILLASLALTAVSAYQWYNITIQGVTTHSSSPRFWSDGKIQR